MSDFEIDDEIQAFIDQSNRFYQDSPQVHDQSQTMGPSRMRDDYNRMCQAFHCPYPEGITASDSHIDHDNYAIPVRYYDNPETPNHTAVIYYHGGGFILGGLESHDSICAEICANSNLTVVAVDYRLAPEYKHPVQFMDALRSFEYLSEKFSSLILVGDSAGGNLAAAVCGATRKRNQKPSGQVLIYPGLGGEELQLPSYVERANAPMLTTADVSFYRSIRSQDAPPVMDPTFSPLMAEEFSGLPPCHAFSADTDPLRDDAKKYVEKLNEAGTKAHYTNEPGLIHGYLRGRHSSEKAGNSFRSICNAIRDLA
ncbi:MAG: alpha/beta hydrolase fold domain-containing protein [Gammaproteobacteria bacterium]|nr:alpha/beta hydrolase fold domain-containing protein [Gammaproteobacteria bacterium]